MSSAPARNRAAAAACPCGSGLAYSRCCRPLHLGGDAPTAEALMRSRYSAFAKHLPDYVAATWHPATRPAEIAPEPTLRWTGLDVIATSGGGADDDTGTVEFAAHYVSAAGPGTLHEVSAFERVDGRWLYRSGRTMPGPDPG
jgi:SEC-C motif-containing protein